VSRSTVRWIVYAALALAVTMVVFSVDALAVIIVSAAVAAVVGIATIRVLLSMAERINFAAFVAGLGLLVLGGPLLVRTSRLLLGFLRRRHQRRQQKQRASQRED